MAPLMRLTSENAYESMVSNGVIHSDEHIVRLIGDKLREMDELDIEVQWKVIDALKSDVLQAACLKYFTIAQL